MAEQVARVRLQAIVDGLEGFDQLIGAFKGLQRAIGPADQQLSQARQEVLDFGRSSKQTEQLLQGMVDALKGLRSQADQCGQTYADLTSDIRQLEAVSRGTTPELERQRTALLQNAAASNRNAKALGQTVEQLERLRGQTRPGSSAYAQLGQDIASARARITGITGDLQEFKNTLTQIPGASLSVLSRQLGTLQRGMQSLRLASDEYLRATERISLLQTIQGRYAGRRQVVANNRMFESNEFAGFVEGAGERLFPLPDTTAALQQRLSELGQELSNVTRNSERYMQVALRMAAVQRDLGSATQGLGQNLAQQLASGELPQTQRNLQEAISQLRAEMMDLDTSTSEGNRQYAQRASLITTLTQQLNRLAEAYRNVADGQRSAGAAQGVPTVQDTWRQQDENIARLELEATQAFDNLNNTARSGLRELQLVEDKHFQERLAQEDEQHQQMLQRQQQAFQRELAAFDARLTAADAIASKRGVLKGALGVQGRDLSPLYQSIVDIGTSKDQSAEMLMRKSPTEVMRDIITTFTDTFDGASRALDAGEKEIREAALRFSGNAKAVRGAFEQIPMGDSRVILGGPQSLFPNADESPKDYTRRVGSLYPTLGVDNRSLGQSVEDFVSQIKFRVQQLRKANDEEAETYQRLNRSLVEFVSGIDNGADTVRAAFGRYKLGQAPITLYPGAREAPRDYVARLGGGVAERLPDFGNFSRKSIRELNATRAAVEQMRSELNPTTVAFKKLETEAVRAIRNIDKELERRNPTGLQGKVGYIAQGVGAIASAGVFGGPEGALGGTIGGGIGAMFGGAAGFAAGSFIGSSFGAYAGMARQSAAATGEFYAQVEKLNIALRGVAGSAKEYAKAQQAIQSAQISLNVPILEATQGFTQLTAAIKGSGGNVGDAEIVFRGITEAIKATGGSAEDVQSAITAMAQIFSKGKVSAEELQGQLGERLPGAVTLFAQATGRSLPQLQKDLQDGVVGLNDVMKFAASLSEKYGEQAALMASSTEDSSARMKVALDDLRLSFGKIVQPITASLQSIIIKLAEMATRALRSMGLVKQAASELGAVDRGRDLSARAADARNALGNNGQSLAEKRRAFYLTQDLVSAATAQKSIAGVEQNIRALQQARAILRDITAEGLSKEQIDILLSRGSDIDKRLAQEQDLLKRLKAANKPTEFQQPTGGKTDNEAAKAEKAAEKLENERQRLAEITAQEQKQLADEVFKHQQELDLRRYELQVELTNRLRQNYVDSLVGPGKAVANEFSQLMTDLDQFNRRQAEIAQQIASARQQLATSRTVATVVAQGATIGGDGTGSFSSAQLKAAAAEAARFTGIANMCSESVKAFYKSLGISLPGVTAWADTVRNAGTVMRDWSKLKPGDIVATGRPGDTPHVGVYTGGNNVFHQSRSRGLVAGNYPDLDYFRQGGYFVRPSTGISAGGRSATAEVKSVNDVAIQEAGINKLLAEQKILQEQLPGLIKARMESYQINRVSPIKEETYQIREQIAALADRSRLELAGTRSEIVDAEVQKAALRRREAEELKSLNADLAVAEKLQDPALVASVTKAIADQTAAYQDQRDAINALTTAQIAFNDAMKFRQDNRIGEGLRDGAQQYVQSIGTMREATSQLAQTGIKGVEDAIFSLVTTGTANFREFAVDILKQTTRMIIQQMILRTVMQAIGALGGGGAGSSIAKTFELPGAAFMPKFNANGNAFAENGIQPFAAGGIVTRPTLFRFANGGAMQTGLMGEAGPEAIIPLRRGANGKLGVAGGGSTNVTVNVDASGDSRVSGNAGQAAALGKAVSQAVQNELLRQKRPGGLLAA